jgi:magnesium transporter
VKAGLAIGVAVLVSIVFQALLSTYLSISLAKSDIDPAVTSGPLTTIISDITTLALYFGIASMLINYF